MKNVHVCTTVAVVILVLASAAFADDQPAAPPSAPQPAPEMAKLRPFQGTWYCTGQINASPFGPAHKTVTQVVAHYDLGGFWLSGHVMETKTDESPMPIEGTFHQTWDAGSKQFLMIWVDNFGGWSQETSSGWDGNTIVFTGDGFGGGKKMGERDGFTTKSAGEFYHTMSFNTGSGWQSLGDETCHTAATAAQPKQH
jgi:hypothetical protein